MKQAAIALVSKIVKSFSYLLGENFDRSSTERITDALSCMIKSVNCENKATVLELIADASKKGDQKL